MSPESELLLSAKNIRDNFFEAIKNLYSSDKAHDLKHALDVEEGAIRVWEIARQEAELRGERNWLPKS